MFMPKGGQLSAVCLVLALFSAAVFSQDVNTL